MNCTQQTIFRPSEILVGIMSYIQGPYPVKDFPPSHASSWKSFVRRIIRDPELKDFLSCNFNIQLVLDDITILDPDTGRIRVDVEDAGVISLGMEFPLIAQRIYRIALETRDFIRFG